MKQPFTGASDENGGRKKRQQFTKIYKALWKKAAEQLQQEEAEQEERERDPNVV